MKKTLYLLSAVILISCSTDVVKGDGDTTVSEKFEKTEAQQKGDFQIKPALDSKEFSNGLLINWRSKGEGPKINTGHVVNINYEVRLKNGELVESNEKVGLKTLPFMVGFGLQTEGWDIALTELNIGDSVEVLIPSKLGRGEKGYKERDKYTGEVRELIPPNSDLVLVLKAESLEEPLREVDGNKVWRLMESGDTKTKFDEGKTIDFHCMVSTPTNPMYINTFRNKPPFSMKLEDSGVVPGLKKALIGSKKGDRLYIFVPADQAYKNKGYQDVVKPNEPLFYNLMVMNVE